MNATILSQPAQLPQLQQSSAFSQLSDQELYQKAQEYGLNARIWKRKFAGLLPEVFRRGLYKKRGFASIHEFAFKLAGMSERSVDTVLNLAKRLAHLPILKMQLETGSQGWSKIEIAARIATPETEKRWAEKVERLSAQTLRTYAGEIKKSINFKSTTINVDEEVVDLFTQSLNSSYVTNVRHVNNKMLFMQGGGELGFNDDWVGDNGGNELSDAGDCASDNWQHDEQSHHQIGYKDWHKISFPVDPVVEHALRIFKQENKCMTFNEAIKLLLTKKDGKQKTVKIEVCPDCATKEGQNSHGRYIPAKVKHLVKSKYGGQCAFRGCKDAATNLHHTKRYALCANHDPDFIVPLCEAHERLVHAGLINNEEAPPQEWQLREQPDIHHPKFQVDQAVQKHRKWD